MPWKPGECGNRNGRPRRNDSIAAILRERLDKRALVARLTAIAMGQVPDCPFICQLSAARMLLAYSDGIPRQVDERKSELKVVVEYIDESESAETGPVIDIDQHSMIESGYID